jgi:hypothetical protein
MKTLKKLPFLMALVVTLIMAACSDVPIEPVGTDDDHEPIIIPPPHRSAVASDSLQIG